MYLIKILVTILITSFFCLLYHGIKNCYDGIHLDCIIFSLGASCGIINFIILYIDFKKKQKKRIFDSTFDKTFN